MKCKALLNFTVPNHPAFIIDHEYDIIDKELAFVLSDRGLIEIIKTNKKEKKKNESDSD